MRKPTTISGIRKFAANWKRKGSKLKSWYCDRCSVEVYQLRCKYCGKSAEEPA